MSQLIVTRQVTSPQTLQSLFTSPLTLQSPFTSLLTFQSLFTSQWIFQSLFTSPLTTQNHVTSQLLILFVTSRDSRSVLRFSALVGSGPVCSTFVLCSAGFASVSGLITSTWTWPSVPPPVPPPLHQGGGGRWIVLCLEHLEATPWGGGNSPPEFTRSPHGLLHYTLCCTPPQTTIPITHCTDDTCTEHTADCSEHTSDYTDHTILLKP